MKIIVWLKSKYPSLYRCLLWFFKHSPLYEVGLKNAIKKRKSKEVVFKKALFGDTNKVISGPFAGLLYLEDSSGSVLLPKLLGTYEAALHPWVRDVISGSYNVLIDIGCAEGYYAIGLARNCPGLKVFAYDLNPQARDLCRQLARINGLEDRVEIGTECGKEQIENHVGGKTLIICDIEGAEMDLLDPEKIPALKHCDLIVEAHDFLNTKITPTLKDRFHSTHRMETVTPLTSSQIECQKIAHLPSEDQQFVLDEQRSPEQVWHRFLTNID